MQEEKRLLHFAQYVLREPTSLPVFKKLSQEHHINPSKLLNLLKQEKAIRIQDQQISWVKTPSFYQPLSLTYL